MNVVDRDKVLEKLSYDPLTGVFIWRSTGKVAGCSNSEGYRNITVGGTAMRAHRLAWLIMTGELPGPGISIDHIDGNRQNNVFTNLRLATNTENTRNAKRYSSNRSGFKGVHWDKKSAKWRAAIMIGGKNKYLGFFKSAELAHQAYCEAAKQLFGEFTCVTR